MSDNEEIIEKIVANMPVFRNSLVFVEDVSKTYNSFIKEINGFSDSLFGGHQIKEDIIQEIKNQTTTIVQVLNKYFEGCHSEAFYLLKEEFANEDGSLKSKKCVIDSTQKSNRFYFRARKNEGKRLAWDEMFHIPNNKREKVKTERFSAPGYPCLYLGSSAYGCWEEIGSPIMGSMFFSGVEVERQFALYDLRKPTKTDFETDFVNTLKKMVLVIACQFKVARPEDPFVPEYIIPQLLLEIVLSSNRLKMLQENPYDLSWGIIYTSTRDVKDCLVENGFMDNIVIPIIDGDCRGSYCQYLASLFRVSAPICCCNSILSISKKYLSYFAAKSCVFKAVYESSRFGKLETRIEKEGRFNQFSYLTLSKKLLEFNADGSPKNDNSIMVYSNDDWEINTTGKVDS